MQAVRTAEREPERDVRLVLLAAASRRYEEGWYRIDREKLTAKEVIDRFAAWSGRFPVCAIDDPLAEEDWDSWTALCKRIGGHVKMAGDDLLCTSTTRIKKAAASAGLQRPGPEARQCGTAHRGGRGVRLARKAGWTVVVAGRTGETEDDWLTDLAVGWGAEHLQVGGCARSERLAKYNRLLAIEKKTHWPLHRL